MSNNRINPNSSIRSGYGFEDMYVLKLCVDWLKAPNLFKELRIQYVPDEISFLKFAIDDVVAILPDGTFLFHQLKYTQNTSTDLWNFDKLIEKGLNKWITSFHNITKSQIVGSGFLITNGIPADEVSHCLRNGRLSLKRIEETYPVVLSKISSLHSIATLNNFFLHFNFLFNTPNKDEFEKQLREILYYDLKVTESGVNKLLIEIARQGSEKFPKTFTINDVRSLLAFDNPRPLNQNFEVPIDFEFFDKSQHKDIIRDLQKTEGGIKVIVGKPGSGKSTYLSKLYNLLNEKLKIFSVRHHYHLNPKDTTFRERLNTDRVKEGLRAEFKKLKEDVLGDLSLQNTEHVPLKEFINQISRYYYSKGLTFVLIVDGLDHVIREGKAKRELNEFLHEILYPQPGLWIVFGTQELAVSSFPNTVYQYCPTEKWIEIKGLNKSGVEKIILKNKSRLKLPKHEELLTEIKREIFAKTQGNPLHLRYVLNILKAKVNSITSDTLKTIPAYKGDIKNYYDDMWRQLQPLSQTFAFAITILDFKLQEEQLFELSSYFTNSPSEISDAFKQIKHLIRIDLYGISVFHNSFMVFMQNQPELKQQKILLYKQIRKWLKNSDNEELRWSEHAKIEYYLGNSKPILSLNRDWVIKSFLDCRDELQITNLLGLSLEASYKIRDFEKVVYLKLLQVSFDNKDYNLHDAIPKIWSTAYVLKKTGLIKYPQFEKLNHFQIKEILVDLNSKGKIRHIPNEAIDRLNDLFLNRDYEYDEVVKSWIELLAYFDTEKFKKAFNFIVQFRDKNNNSAKGYFRFYLQKVLDKGNENKVGQLLSSNLRKDERQELIEALILNELLINSNKWSDKIAKILETVQHSNFSKLYLFVRGKCVPKDLTLADASKFPTKVEFHSSKSDFLLDLYMDNFFVGLFMCFNGQETIVKNWINGNSEEWQVLLMKKLLQIAVSLSTCHISKIKFSISDILAPFEELRKLDFYEDNEIYELRRGVVPYAIKTIIKTGAIINIYAGFSIVLSIDDINQLTKSIWLYRDDIIEVLNSKFVNLSTDSYHHFRKYVIGELQRDIMPFRDRSQRYIDLAIQAKNIGQYKDAELFLNKAAENIIAYGNHKDILLYNIMKSIKYCGLGGSLKVKDYIRIVAPYVYNIEKLTDGDETGSFIYDLGDIIQEFDSNLLYNFYLHSLKKRDYYLSEALFSNIISSLDFSNSIDFAIGNTAIGNSPYNALLHLSNKNKDAKKVLLSIQAIFGTIDYSKNETSQQSSNKKGKPKKKPNYGLIIPSSLKKHLEGLTPDGFYQKRYAQKEYLLGWSEYWLNKKDVSEFDIINTLQEIVEPKFEEVNEELLDFIYPYALKTNREFAFQCVVWAHANSSSWSGEYIRNLKYSQDRWNKIIKEFPERIDEFYDKSIYYTGMDYHQEGSYFTPIPKSTQFFIDAGNLSRAESVTEDYLKVLPTLFPDVKLETPSFIKDERKIEEFEILLSRFEWLSPLVRERAAWYLGELLQNDKSGEIHSKYIDWLIKLKLESFACYGLIVLLRSLNTPDSYSYKHINVQKGTSKIISLRCMATDLLLSAIADKLKQKLHISTPFIITVSYDNKYLIKSNFLKTLGTYLPLIYHDYIDQLQKKTKLNVQSIWQGLFKQRLDDLDIVEQKSDKDYGNERRSYITGRSHIISEILKSTFFNLIDYLYESKIITEGDLSYYTIKNFPVDISVWNIIPSSVPDWWCKFKKLDQDKHGDVLIASLENEIADIINIDEKTQVLQLSGSIITPHHNHYESTLQGSIRMLPFAYKVMGVDLPADEEIYNAVNESCGKWFPKIYDYSKFNFFDNQLLFYTHAEDNNILLKDLDIIPLVSRMGLSTIPMWQFYRMFFEYYLLAPWLQNDMMITTKDSKIQYLNRNEVTSQVHDFGIGIRDNATFSSDVPYGNYLLINKDYLNDFLSKNRVRLGYIYKISYKTRDSHYSEDFKEAHFYKSLNLSSLII